MTAALSPAGVRLTAGLGCCRIGEKFLNSFQQGGTLFLSFGREVKYKRLKRTLGLLYVCLQGILFCGPLEADPLMPGNVRHERKDCSQMGAVILKDDGGRSVTTGIEPKQSIGESSTEGGGSIRECFQPEQINAAKNRNQGCNDSKGPSRDIFDKISEIIQAFLLGLMVSVPPIVMALSSTNRLTLRLTGKNAEHFCPR